MGRNKAVLFNVPFLLRVSRGERGEVFFIFVAHMNLSASVLLLGPSGIFWFFCCSPAIFREQDKQTEIKQNTKPFGTRPPEVALKCRFPGLKLEPRNLHM